MPRPPGGCAEQGQPRERRTLLGALLVVELLLSPACASAPSIRDEAGDQPSCLATSPRTLTCTDLDALLVAARHRFLRCVGEQASRGHLGRAHECYRSLRLLESARWWLRSIAGQDEMDQVYQPSQTTTSEFLCRMERLTRATTSDELQRLYVDTIRWYP